MRVASLWRRSARARAACTLLLCAAFVGLSSAYNPGNYAKPKLSRESKRRSQLTEEKVQQLERTLRFADYGDGHARLNGYDLFDKGTKLMSELIVEQYPDLIELELDDNWISDDACGYIANAIVASKGLVTLHLDGNQFGLSPECAKELAHALAKSPKLKFLYMDDNHFDDQAAAQFANLVQESTTIKTLTMKRNQMTDVGVSYFIEAAKHSKSLWLHEIILDGCKRHGADGRDHVSVSGSLLDKLDDAIKERELNHLVGGPGHAEL